MIQINENKLVRAICQESFYEFLREFWEVLVAEDPVFNWHVKYLCDELQHIAELIFAGKPKEYDLVVNIAPGSTKSTIFSQAFPAWTWCRMPSFRHINASYAYALSLRDSLRCRDVVQSEKYQACFPNIQLREDENMKGLFVNTEKGSRLAVGVRGFVTGYHAHCLTVDDPLNPEQSYSEADLRKVNRWMTTTLPSRGIHKSDTPMVIVQQRLAYGDPSGEFLLKGGRIKHINIPGELTNKVNPPELKAFYKDGLFDAKRMPRRVLDELKDKLGAYGYAAQVLQDPVPMEGAMFEVNKLNFMEEAPPMVRYVRSWDKAGTKGGGAYTVGVLQGIDKNKRYWILDIVRGQWSAIDRENKIAETAERDEGVYGDIPIRVEVEGGSGGKESGERTASQTLAGFRVILYHPTGEKEARAYPFASQVGAGNVYVLQRHWTKDFVEELRLYPHWKYKDQVDAAADGNNHLSKAKRRIGAL